VITLEDTESAAERYKKKRERHTGKTKLELAVAAPDADVGDCDNANSDHDIHDMDMEIEKTWILNWVIRKRALSEKFFITYGQNNSQGSHIWRRVTVTISYLDRESGCLESKLAMLRDPRERSDELYYAIRHHLPKIVFFDTVTNLEVISSGKHDIAVHPSEDIEVRGRRS
jgi:hypothetical protein